MKYKLALLRRYIREAIDLGNTQFAPDRNDLSADQPQEKNTPDEQRIYDALMKRVHGTGKIDPKTAKDLVSLINSEKYGSWGSGFFSGPDSDTLLYRGTVLDDAWAAEHLPSPNKLRIFSNKDELEAYLQSCVSSGKDEIKLSKKYTFTDRRGWSPKATMAASWARSYLNPEETIAVVLVLVPSENDEDSLLDFSKNVYKTKFGYDYHLEEEVLNLKDVKISSVFAASFKAR